MIETMQCNYVICIHMFVTMISNHFSVFLWDAVAESAKQKEKENEWRAYNWILLSDRIPRLITVHWMRLGKGKNWEKINFSCVPRDPTSRFVHSVHWLVGWSVGRSPPFYFIGVYSLLGLTACAQMPYVHQHATGVAVYSALFKNHLTRR